MRPDTKLAIKNLCNVANVCAGRVDDQYHRMLTVQVNTVKNLVERDQKNLNKDKMKKLVHDVVKIIALTKANNSHKFMFCLGIAVSALSKMYGLPSLFYREECGDFILREYELIEPPLDYQI